MVRGKDLQSRGFASRHAATWIDAIPSKDLKHFRVEEVDAIRLRFRKGKREVIKGVSVRGRRGCRRSNSGRGRRSETDDELWGELRPSRRESCFILHRPLRPNRQ